MTHRPPKMAQIRQFHYHMHNVQQSLLTQEVVESNTRLHHFFGNSQLRIDQWNTLKQIVSQLNSISAKPKDDPDVQKELASTKESWKKKLRELQPLEHFFAFPGREVFSFIERTYKDENYVGLDALLNHICYCLANHSYSYLTFLQLEEDPKENYQNHHLKLMDSLKQLPQVPYFEVLVVKPTTVIDEFKLRKRLWEFRAKADPFIYELVFVNSYQEAIAAILINFNIQAVVIYNTFSTEQKEDIDFLPNSPERFLSDTDNIRNTLSLSDELIYFRPELDLYHFTDNGIEKFAALQNKFRRMFYNEKSVVQELHLTIIEGLRERFYTPFFDALKVYSSRPTSVFHALPISRGSSLVQSRWITDMYRFYGKNIFMAETSSTSGGLDSLLDPHGPIRKAQEMAAKTFGADRTYWVTNGTSTANKIVLQAILRPGDVVLIDRNCHKSHHYGAVLSGAQFVYLEAYPKREYALYGAVPLRSIKEKLLAFRKAGHLSKVKTIILTNCTFDGIVYNVEQVMEECLAIKPDLIFIWDEAWWAFAHFHPLYRKRTGMNAATVLHSRYRTEEYKDDYSRWKAEHQDKDWESDETWLNTRLKPDPALVRIRVYVTQSTHKTLTALRQGSMIHIRDQDFKRSVHNSFVEAFYTHTSTSPNYQILASLDVGRRQMELEGYELVQKQLERAYTIRNQISHHPTISGLFKILDTEDLVPAEYRNDSQKSNYDLLDLNKLCAEWDNEEFVLDPCRLTLFTGAAGIDGDTFKNKYLMDMFEIQVNKTSINSVLFMTTIGTSRSAVAYLIESLLKISLTHQDIVEEFSESEHKHHAAKVLHLTERLPHLPNFSHLHENFMPLGRELNAGSLREPFFLAYDETACEHFLLDDPILADLEQAKRKFVSSTFVIPYPPGFPILVPGQVITQAVIDFLLAVDVKEIHGFHPELGLKVFTEAALEKK